MMEQNHPPGTGPTVPAISAGPDDAPGSATVDGEADSLSLTDDSDFVEQNLPPVERILRYCLRKEEDKAVKLISDERERAGSNFRVSQCFSSSSLFNDASALHFAARIPKPKPRRMKSTCGASTGSHLTRDCMVLHPSDQRRHAQEDLP